MGRATQVEIFVGFSSTSQSGAMSMERLNAQSSVTLTVTTVARAARLAALGNTPTTEVRRFTSPKSRSSPFVL